MTQPETKNYCITKNGYRIRSEGLTRENPSQENFWDENAVRLSLRAQFGAYRIARQLAEENSCKKILDIGCGVGSQLNQYFDTRCEIYGVDQPHAVEFCKKKYTRGVYLADDLETPRYPLKQHIATADLIVCADVIEHLLDPDKVLDYIKQFADERTWIVISTPERDALNGRGNLSPENPYHVREWNYDEFHQYILASGFKISKHEIVYSNRPGFDLDTFKWFVEKWFRRLPIKHAQAVVCKKKV